jgi:hypothetical protein
MPEGEDDDGQNGEAAGCELTRRDLGHGRATYGRCQNGSARERDDSGAEV